RSARQQLGRGRSARVLRACARPRRSAECGGSRRGATLDCCRARIRRAERDLRHAGHERRDCARDRRGGHWPRVGAGGGGVRKRTRRPRTPGCDRRSRVGGVRYFLVTTIGVSTIVRPGTVVAFISVWTTPFLGAEPRTTTE